MNSNYKDLFLGIRQYDSNLSNETLKRLIEIAHTAPNNKNYPGYQNTDLFELGEVSIDLLERFLPKLISIFLTLFLLIVSLFVLVIGLELGFKHINAGWIFNSSSIKIPFHLIGGKAEPIKLAWMYMSLPIGIVFLISVNVELILRNILTNFTKLDLPEDYDKQKLETH